MNNVFYTPKAAKKIAHEARRLFYVYLQDFHEEQRFRRYISEIIKQIVQKLIKQTNFFSANCYNDHCPFVIGVHFTKCFHSSHEFSCLK